MAWSEKSLGEVVEKKVFQGSPKGPGTFIYIDISSIDNKKKAIVAPKKLPVGKAPSRAKQHVKTGDVLVSMTRPNLNAVAMVPPELNGAIASTGFDVLRPVGIHQKLLFMRVTSAEFVNEMNGRVQGALYPAVRPSDIRKHRLSLPELDEQAKLADYIESLFVEIDAGARELENVRVRLELYHQSILKHAIHGKLVPQDPKDQSAQSLLKRIQESKKALLDAGSARNKPDFEISPSAKPFQTPVGWEWARIHSICERVTVGFVGKMSDQYIESGIPFFRSQNIRPFAFDPQGLKFISEEFHRKIRKSTMRAGDVAIVRTGFVGQCCVIPEMFTQANCSDLVIIQRPMIDPRLIAIYLNGVAQDFINQNKVGVAQSHFNTETVANMAIPIPPRAEQTRICDLVDQIQQNIGEVKTQIHQMSAQSVRLKQSILQKAFSGSLIPNSKSP